MPSDLEQIREFVFRLLSDHGYTEQVDDDDSLILSGLLDSLAVVQIVVFLEKRFGIDFSTIYFDQTNFDSISQIIDFIKAQSP